MRKRKYTRFAIVFLIPLAFVISQCFDKNKAADPRGAAYAGSASCLKCHKNVEQNYLHSAHYLTSRAAASNTMHGSFVKDSNQVILNDSLKIVMEKHGDSLYQAGYIHNKLNKKRPFDITFGSNRGETFLSWVGNEVHQLPVTYYISLHQWANSPGYSTDSANFSRVLSARCFECHSSFIKSISAENGSPDQLDKSSLILGIDCERCHGPAAEHVDFQTKNPDVKEAKYIVKISTLSRVRRMDLCSVCHAGNSNVMTKSTFDFKPGDTLANFTSGEKFHRAQDVTKMDVHGNQVKLLTSSLCYMESNIECTTCHSLHDTKVKTVQTYSQYCTNCHSEAKHNFCKMAAQIGPAITSNCIDCHMPLKASNAIVIVGGKQTAPPFLARMHRIAVYPEETEKVREWFKAAK